MNTNGLSNRKIPIRRITIIIFGEREKEKDLQTTGFPALREALGNITKGLMNIIFMFLQRNSRI